MGALASLGNQRRSQHPTQPQPGPDLQIQVRSFGCSRTVSSSLGARMRLTTVWFTSTCQRWPSATARTQAEQGQGR